MAKKQMEMSEALIKRDNFFHSAWMILKSRRPDIWKEMTEVELYVAGCDEPVKPKVADPNGENAATEPEDDNRKGLVL